MKNIKNIAIVAALIAAVVVLVVAKKNKPMTTAAQDKTPVAARVVPTMEADTDVPNPTTAEKLPRLVDLGAKKCIPCKMMAPILEDLKKTYAGKMDVQFIDVWENPDAGGQYGIKVIPTQIFYDAQGKELFRHEGFSSKEDIMAKWKEFGVELEKNSE